MFWHLSPLNAQIKCFVIEIVENVNRNAIIRLEIESKNNI